MTASGPGPQCRHFAIIVTCSTIFNSWNVATPLLESWNTVGRTVGDWICVVPFSTEFLCNVLWCRTTVMRERPLTWDHSRSTQVYHFNVFIPACDERPSVISDRKSLLHGAVLHCRFHCTAVWSICMMGVYYTVWDCRGIQVICPVSAFPTWSYMVH